MDLTTLRPNLCRKMVIVDCDIHAIGDHTCEPICNEFEPVPRQRPGLTKRNSPFTPPIQTKTTAIYGMSSSLNSPKSHGKSMFLKVNDTPRYPGGEILLAVGSIPTRGTKGL